MSGNCQPKHPNISVWQDYLILNFYNKINVNHFPLKKNGVKSISQTVFTVQLIWSETPLECCECAWPAEPVVCAGVRCQVESGFKFTVQCSLYMSQACFSKTLIQGQTLGQACVTQMGKDLNIFDMNGIFI